MNGWIEYTFGLVEWVDGQIAWIGSNALMSLNGLIGLSEFCRPFRPGRQGHATISARVLHTEKRKAPSCFAKPWAWRWKGSLQLRQCNICGAAHGFMCGFCIRDSDVITGHLLRCRCLKALVPNASYTSMFDTWLGRGLGICCCDECR